MIYLFFDTETGGLDTSYSLLTAYFALYNEKFDLIDELYLQLKPNTLEEFKVSPEALKVCNIDINTHFNDPKTVTYAEGNNKLIDMLIKNKIPGKKISYRPAGHNLDFDLQFIKAYLMKEDVWKKYIHHNQLDTLRVLTFLQDCGILPVELGKLESLVKYFNIPVGQTHNAKGDTLMTVEVYKAMRNLLMGKKNEMGNVCNNSLLEIIEK